MRVELKFDKKEIAKNHVEVILEAFKQALVPDRITTEYPRERRRYPERFRGFIIFDIEKCINCYRCAQICPANAIQMEPYGKLYPSIDYTKCIFCHFCVESCPTGALNSTKIHDIAFKSMDDMVVDPKSMTKLPEIEREDKTVVEYHVTKFGLKLLRKKELEELEVPKVEVKVAKRVVSCEEPESCVGCRQCVEICPHGGLILERCEVTLEGEVLGKGCIIKVTEDCVGCCLCVRQCPMQILKLKEVE